MNKKRPTRTALLAVSKYALSGLILAYLFHQATRDESFASLGEQPKNWSLLAVATTVYGIGLMITFQRLCLLARAAGLPLTLAQATRLGLLGILFNFLTLGVVGGDVVKAAFLSRRSSGRHVEAVVSVFVDRASGLYALLVLATFAILLTDFSKFEIPNQTVRTTIDAMCGVIVTITAASTVGLILIAFSLRLRRSLPETLGRIPKFGHVFARLTTAVQVYRSRPRLMAAAGLMSIGNHACFAVAVYLIACGLPGEAPSFLTHFLIVPVSGVAGSLPLPGGMGSYEYAMDFLYRGLSPASAAGCQGFAVALVYRTLTLLAAASGVVCYLLGRREMKSLLNDVQQNGICLNPMPPSGLATNDPGGGYHAGGDQDPPESQVPTPASPAGSQPDRRRAA